jgi:CheY-like chemotaxis protein
MAGPLDGRCILVVEDEAAVSLMVAHLAVEAGATVIGPIADAATALTLVETEAVDCAVLDYKLIDGTSLPVADALMERGVPFLFASAYDLAAIAPRFAWVPCVGKVYVPERLLQMIVAVCDRAQMSARR